MDLLNNINGYIGTVKKIDCNDYVVLGTWEYCRLSSAINMAANFILFADNDSHSKCWDNDLKEQFDSVCSRFVDYYKSHNKCLYKIKDVSVRAIDDYTDLLLIDVDREIIMFDTTKCHIKINEFIAFLRQNKLLDTCKLELFLDGKEFNKSQQEKAVSDRWDKIRTPMFEKIKGYVNTLLDHGCVCDHAQVTSHAWRRFFNDETVKLMTDSIKEKAKAKDKDVRHKYLSREVVMEQVREAFEARGVKRIYKVNLDQRRKDCQTDHQAY